MRSLVLPAMTAGGASFFRNSLFTLGRQATGIVVGLVLTVITARCLGPQGQGEYAIVVLLPMMLLNFLNLGIGTSASYYTGKNALPLPDIYKTNMAAGFGLGLFAAAVGVSLAAGWAGALFGQAPALFLLAVLPAVPFLFVNAFLQGIFQGREDFRSYNASLLTGQIASLVLTVLLVPVLDTGMAGAIAGYVAGPVLTFALIVRTIAKRYGLRLRDGRFSPDLLKLSLGYGIKVHINNLLIFLNYRLSMLMLGAYATAADVGVYAVAVNMAEQLWFFSRAISTVLFARVTASREEDDKNDTTAMASRVVLAVTVLIAAVLFLLAGFALRMLFGNEYADGANVVRVLLPGIVLVGIERILSSDLSARGNINANLYVAVASSVLNVGLIVLLVPRYATIGAAFATSVVYAATLLLKIAVFRRMTRVPYRSLLWMTRHDWRRLRAGVLRKVRPLGGET